MILAQDSTRKAEPVKPTSVSTPANTPTQATTTTNSIPANNNPVLTVPPIYLPEQPTPAPRPRRKKIVPDSVRLAALLQDSLKLVAQRDSLNKIDTIGKKNIGATYVSSVPILDKSNNPFDILRGATDSTNLSNGVNKIEKKPEATLESPSLLNRQTYSKNFLFWLFFVTLLLTAFVIPFSRTVVSNCYNALLSDTMLRQMFRDSINKPGGSFAYYALYLLFWINLAAFIFLVLLQKGYKFPFGQLTLFGFCLIAVALTYLVKHILLAFIASIFPITKEVRVYNFIIMIAGILGGLFLLPLNILIAYAPADLSKIFFYGAIGVLIAMYAFRYLRSLSITGSFLIENRFHFLLYFCSVEIAPVFILIKLIIIQLNNLQIK